MGGSPARLASPGEEGDLNAARFKDNTCLLLARPAAAAAPPPPPRKRRPTHSGGGHQKLTLALRLSARTSCHQRGGM